MTDTTEIKAEATAEAKSILAKIKSGFDKTTAVVSDMLKIFWPQWLKAETAWNAWTWTKRGIAVGVLAVGVFFVWKFSIDITRISIGSFRAASEYGRGSEVTKADLAPLASKSEVAELRAELAKTKADLAKAKTDMAAAEASVLASVDDKIDKAQAPTSQITTGSLPPKKTAKKSPAKKTSSSVTDPSTWQMP